jgi:hypothetical protein
MMSTARRKTQASVAEINPIITGIVALQMQKAEIDAALKSGLALLRDLMEGAELKRFATPEGAEALLYETESYAWKVEKLEKALSPDEFEGFCPRKPDGARLRSLLDIKGPIDPAFGKALKGCARVSVSTKLTVREAGAVEQSAGVA